MERSLVRTCARFHVAVNVRKLLLLCVVLLLGLSLTSPQGFAEDWPKYRKDLSNSGSSSETGINSANVKSLKTKWTFVAGGGISAEPAVATVNGVSIAFVGAWNGTFYALDAVTGQQLWSFVVDMVGRCNPTKGCRIGSSAQVDAANNLVFFGAKNAYVYALNATTGALVWKKQVGDPRAYEIWASPAVYNGAVFVGVSSEGDEPCIPGGEVIAFNELTGTQIWSFNTIDQSTCPSGTCVGGGVWASVAIDAANGIVYAGTGNPGATCNPPTQNAGLYPDSVLALSAATGKLLNYYQAIKDDHNDMDFGSSPVLHTSARTNQCAGTQEVTSWVTEASKDGHVYTLGRDAGGLNGALYDNAVSPPEIIGTPGLKLFQQTSSCSPTQKIIDFDNYITVPSSNGHFAVLAQNGIGATGIKFRRTISQGMPIYAAPTIIQDIALFGGNDGNLHVMGKTGQIVTTFPIGAEIYSGVAISNSRVYFGASNGTLYCMSVNGN